MIVYAITSFSSFTSLTLLLHLLEHQDLTFLSFLAIILELMEGLELELVCQCCLLAFSLDCSLGTYLNQNHRLCCGMEVCLYYAVCASLDLLTLRPILSCSCLELLKGLLPLLPRVTSPFQQRSSQLPPECLLPTKLIRNSR